MKLLRVFGLINLLAAILLPACNSVNRAIPETIVPTIRVTATTAVATPTIIEIGAWKTYQNTQAGYSAEYPADWTVSEQAGNDGSIVTNFSPASGAGITVIVQNGEFTGAGNSDIPNTHCEQVRVGGMAGMLCFDTINFATSTIVVANGKTFTIATLGKRIEENIYGQFLLGFQIIR